MIIVRCVRPADLDALVALAHETGPGLTSFKPDRYALAARIDRARRTLAGEAAPYEAGYFFVMEDGDTGEVAGVCGIESEVGLEQPFYNYRVSTVVHASKDLGVWTKMSLLNISHDLTGYAEVCSLFLGSRFRAAGVGSLLSRSRFMFMAQFRDRFPKRLCAEMRGHFDAEGQSPFWRSVGAHFYQIGFNDADYLSSHGKKSFVAELMPRYPVYMDLLPDDAIAAVGRTHRDTEPARKMLEAEGLRYENHVDIFDAGPVLECHIADLRTVRESELAQVVLIDDDVPLDDTGRSLISNTSLGDFRCGVVPRVAEAARIALRCNEARTLDVDEGDWVRVLDMAIGASGTKAPAH